MCLVRVWNAFRILLLYLHNVLDPMGAIIPRMPRKRQKVSYIDRLLELDVITDKKQCRKRKQRKNAKSTDVDGDKSNGKLLNNFTLLWARGTRARQRVIPL